jgi:nucleoside-diphosphate-sugar epimerase
LGKAIASEAAAQGHAVVGLDPVPWPEGVDVPGGVEVHLGSYENVELLQSLLPGCDALINTGGPNGEHLTQLGLPEFLHLNITCVARMLECAVDAGVRRIALSSTMEILLGRDWTTSGAVVVDEGFAPRTDSHYSISRLLQEGLAREFARRRPVSIASLRYMAFGYAPDDKLGLLLLARYVTPRDAARAAIRAASVEGLEGDVFHIGPSSPLTNEDVLSALENPEAVIESYYPGACEVLRANGQEFNTEYFWPVTRIRKARQILDWEPEFTFEVWLRDHGWRAAT